MKIYILSFVFNILIVLSLNAAPFHTQKESMLNSASVVKVFTHGISPNYDKPWSMGNPFSATGSGVIIEGNLILTAAHVVSDATYIEVKKHADPKKYFARVKWIAPDADLALLELEEILFFKNTVAKKLGETPKRQEGVAVYGYPEGGNVISITQGIISRIEMTEYSFSSVDLLTIQIDAAINAGNSGGPAFNAQGDIVGIAIQGLTDSDNIGYIAPVSVIEHFFEDIKDGQYDGFPSDGLFIQEMENVRLKEYYGMNNRTGILATEIIKGSSVDGYIEREDIILEVDGYVVADNMTVKSETLGRISVNQIIAQHFVGDTLKVKVLRDKKELTIKVPLKTNKFLAWGGDDKSLKYYIFGGFVFLPLNYNNMMNIRYTSKEFLYEYILSHTTDTGYKHKEQVFISTILADKINAGYRVSYQIVRKVNDAEVDSFEDLIKKIASSPKIVKITLTEGIVIVVNKDEVLQAEKRIMSRYGIKKLTHSN